MTYLLHVGDTHLGYRQYHLNQRLEDFAEAFREVITAAIEQEVDAVVHAGDLFHTSRPGITPLQTVLTELQRLQQAEIPFLLIVGNHERTHDRNWVELLQEVGLATRLDSSGTQIEDTTLYGLDHVPPGQRDSLDYQFDPPDTDNAVLVGHGLFTPFNHGDWDTTRILAKSPVAFDLLLVGDDHTPHHRLIEAPTPENDQEAGAAIGTGDPNSKQGEHRSIPISYAGSTERTKADQRQARSYSLVTVPSEGGVIPDKHIVRQEIRSACKFEYVDVTLKRGDGLETVEQAIRNQVDSLDDAVLKVTLLPAEEDVDTSSPESTGSTSEDGESDDAVHERVPVGPIENLGGQLGALITRVSDRRKFFKEEREYQAVEFADIDAAVRDRRRNVTVSEPADTLLDMALNPDGFPDSKIADTAQQTVTDLLEETSPATFHVDSASKSESGSLDGSTDMNEGEDSVEDLLSELID